MRESISFVIPVMNEAQSIAELYRQIAAEMSQLGNPWEVLFIDDGSTDESWPEILALAEQNPENVRAIRYRKNLGKTRALEDGFAFSRGEIVFTLDGDLQDDPREIGRFLEALAEQYDLVSGWKAVRKDSLVKVISSRLFNGMARMFLDVRIHDINCGYKCYRREVVRALPLYGQMHRVIPGLARVWGFRVGEIPVQHHARQFGESKFGRLGILRLIPGYLDLFSVVALRILRFFPSFVVLCFHELLLRRTASASLFLIRDTVPRGFIPLWEKYCGGG